LATGVMPATLFILLILSVGLSWALLPWKNSEALSGKGVGNADDNAATLQSYLLELSRGNISGAVLYMTDNVEFQWNGAKELFPFAGSYSGHSGVISFFQAVGKYFAEFQFTNFSMLIPNNETIVLTFLETSTSAITGRTYSVVNVVFYSFNQWAEITAVNIYLDTSTVAEVMFCKTGYELQCVPQE